MLTISGILNCQFIFDSALRRNCIKFCVTNEIKCESTFEMFTVAFGKSTASKTQVQLWYNRFKEGRVDVNDYARPGNR